VAARDRRRVDIAKFLEAYRSLGVPEGTAEEQGIWVILARHGTKDGATKAMQALWKRYVDVNEFRAAKATEVAEIIERYVKNDAYRVAAHARGFLRTFFDEFQTIHIAAADGKTADQFKKYLVAQAANGAEIAMALALYYCAAEKRVEEELEAPGEKPRKRPEKDLTAAANRLRLLFTFAAHGAPTYKGKVVSSGRSFLSAWSYSSLPPLPKTPPPKREPIVIPTPVRIVRGQAPAKKTAASKAPVKNVPVKKVPVSKAPAKKTAAKKTPTKKAVAKKAVAKKAVAKKAVAKKAVAKKTTKKTARKPVAKKKTVAKKADGKARPKTSRTARAGAGSKKSSRR